MIELFAIQQTLEHFSKPEGDDNSMTLKPSFKSLSVGMIILALIISFGTAYLCYSCNEYEVPATRALYTIFSFLFSGIYLIFYFVYNIILGYKCGSGRNISNLVRNFSKKRA